MAADLPTLPGVLDRAQVAACVEVIAAQQEPDGALPWTTGQHTDTWNHVESAMALLVGGHVDAAHRAYDWCLATQRADGSWPMRVVAGAVEDASTESNMTAYLAVGVWHHWLVRRDEAFVRRTWPAVRAALDHVVGMQLPFGGIAWVRGEAGVLDDGALLAGSASIFHALRAGLALSQLMDRPQPEWELAAGRLGHALLDARWDEFVVPGLGVRCVDTNPWVTAAETCELALALDALGRRGEALRLLRDVQHLRSERGGYWTGYVWPDDAVWPAEETTWTAAAMVLAVDALSGTTAGADLFRGSSLPADLPEIGLECGCADETLPARAS